MKSAVSDLPSRVPDSELLSDMGFGTDLGLRRTDLLTEDPGAAHADTDGTTQHIWGTEVSIVDTSRRCGISLILPRPQTSPQTRPPCATQVGCGFIPDLPPDLVDRLESLDFGSDLIERYPVRIASSRLQRLRIKSSADDLGPMSLLELDCPALVELDLTVLFPDRPAVPSAPHPQLASQEPVRSDQSHAHARPGESFVEDPTWLLSGAPLLRLRELSGVRVAQPDLLASLCACGSLVLLKGLHLDATRLPNTLVLRLPGQLEYLDLHIELGKRPDVPLLPPLDLLVEAPGLLDFKLTTRYTERMPCEEESSRRVRVRLHNCPHLFRLGLNHTDALLSIQGDKGEGAPAATQLRSLSVNDLGAARLVDLLARHGTRLRDFSFWQGFRTVSNESWSLLMRALSGLPQLISLRLNVYEAPSLSLACPQLRTLILTNLSKEAKVVLACPLLEKLRGIGDPSRHLELALPAPNLECTATAWA
ncbi:hypothetical protein PAPYR_529 [Paratrimastix pyriformis]|uniref:Uncharacterized protein n=1 Tax=Paratrimastix pyriformis TaxID=342808 RepID=A0ABQ8V0F6_9EUKA|nr:hypothetical protein PAPYR_529 [Paratrimastix pyriformis]